MSSLTELIDGRARGALSLIAPDGALLRRMRSGFVWNVVAAVFNQGSTFLLGLVVANVLGRERFGAYALVLSTVLLFGNVSQFGMGLTTTRYIAEFRASDKARAARVLAASLSVAVLAAVAAPAIIWTSTAPLIVARVLGHADLASLLRAGAPAITFIVLGGICSSALAGFENFRNIGLCGVVSGLVYLGAGAFAAVRWGLPGVIISIVISGALQAVILFALVLREAGEQEALPGRTAFREIALETPLLARFAFPAALTGFAAAPVLWIVNAIVARQAGGLGEVALFTAANSVRLMVMFVPTLVGGVGSSVLNNYRGLGDHAGYRKAFWANFAAVTAATLLVMSAVMIASPLVLRAFGRGFGQGRGPLMIIAMATLPEALTLATFQIVQTYGRMWSFFFRISLPRESSIIGSALFLVPRYGAVGACLSYLIGMTVGLVTTVLLVRSFDASWQ